MSLAPTIRQGFSQDVPIILSFIRATAEEQAPGAKVAATEERLSSTLHLSDVTESKEQRIAWPILIFSPDVKPAGLLIYFYNYSTWAATPGVCLEELYVVPEYRRHGYARLLIEAMALSARVAGCVQMDWVCLQGNEKAQRFHEKLGAKRMGHWVVLEVDENGITRLSNGEQI